MSKLKNAPLNEVIFELKWDSNSGNELNKFQILLGSMFASLKSKYPNKESLIPDSSLPLIAFLQKPTYRFRSSDTENKLFQLGPGLLTVNSVGSNYDWDIFCNDIKTIVATFKELSDIGPGLNMEIGMTYLDFFNFDFENEKVIDYLRKYMHVNIETDLFETKTFGFNSSSVVNNSVFNISINTGYRAKVNKGLVVSSKLSKSDKQDVILSNYENILNDFHEYLSLFFKKMIDGELRKELC